MKIAAKISLLFKFFGANPKVKSDVAMVKAQVQCELKAAGLGDRLFRIEFSSLCGCTMCPCSPGFNVFVPMKDGEDSFKLRAKVGAKDITEKGPLKGKLRPKDVWVQPVSTGASLNVVAKNFNERKQQLAMRENGVNQ